MILKYILLLLFFPLFVPACKSEPAASAAKGVLENEAPFLLSLPAGGGLSFIGTAGRRSDPKETIRLALEDAARRVAVFHQVSGEYLTQTVVGSGAFDYSYYVDTSLRYDEQGSGRYVGALQFNADTDSAEYENTFFIRVSYPSALPVPVTYYPVRSGVDRKPEWVDNPPERIMDYEVGVGFAGRRASLSDTCTASYQNAIFAIIRNLNAVSQNRDILYQGASLFDYRTFNVNTLYAYGSLRNFYALDTWIDPKTKSVWTLAIAKKAE